jgi:hypothetical protein
VPSGENGYAALAAFTQQTGEATPVYNSSGLLCSINGDPTSGCGQAVSGGYLYWSYWHGTSGTWQYANTGATATMQNGDVEGWRFENPGKSNPSDPPPGAAPNFASICGAVPATPTTAATTTPAAPQTNGASSADSSVPQAAPPSAGSHQSTAPGPAGASTSTTSGGGYPMSSSPAPGSRSGATTSPSPGQPGSTSSRSVKPGAGAQSLRASPATAHLGGGGSAVPLLIGGGVLAVLIIASLLRWRRSTEPK